MRSKSLIFVVGGLAAAAIVAALAYWLLVLQPRVAPPASVASAPAPASSSPAAASAAAPTAAKPTAAAAPSPASTPAFDIVRVEPSGDAVVAGRAAPGAKVELSDDGKPIGDAAANDAGQFVILPTPLSPGRHPLRLSAKVGGDAPQVSDVLVVEVAAAPAVAAASPAAAKPAFAVVQPTPQATVAAASPAAAKPAAAVVQPTPQATAAAAASPTPTPAASVAAATPTLAASAAASTPTPAAAAAPAPTATVVVVSGVRPIDPAGLEAVGSAPPGVRVRLRLNNSALAEVIAGVDGVWRLTIERGLIAGDYVLEAAAVDAAGAILARAEAPFVYPQREAVADVAMPAPAATPSPAANPSPAAAEPSPPLTPAASSAAAEPTPTATPAAPAATTRAAAAPAPSAAAPAPSPAAPASTPAAAETPVATAAHAVVAEVLTYTVVKGDNLWDMAVKYYGDGLRYADIFSANASQIHDPNLIYVGQIFVVPAKPTANPPAAR